jgi:hypothetical protein
MIAAGRRDHAAGRNRLCQQVRERAARLERSGMLQALELQRERPRRGAEIRKIDMEDRRVADVRPDQALVSAMQSGVISVFNDIGGTPAGIDIKLGS